MENGLACFATKLIALPVDEEIAKKQAPQGLEDDGSCTTRRSLRQSEENAKTLINVFCAVFTVLEYRASGSLKATNTYQLCLTCKTRCAFDGVLRRHNLLQRDYSRERNAENVFSGI